MWPGHDCIAHLHAQVHPTPSQATFGPKSDVNKDISIKEVRQVDDLMRKRLQKVRQRKYFDSGEYYLQDSRHADAGGGAGEVLPVAWKVLGPAAATPCPAGNSPVSRHASTANSPAAKNPVSRHASTANILSVADSQPLHSACQHNFQIHSGSSKQPTAAAHFANPAVPTGGQPLAFQYRPSRLKNASNAIMA